MPNGGKIDFQVGFKVDKSGLNQLNKALWTIQDKFSNATGNQLKGGLGEAVQAAEKLQSILNSAWNSKLGQLNLDKVNKGIKDSFESTQKLSKSLSGAGQDGREIQGTDSALYDQTPGAPRHHRLGTGQRLPRRHIDPQTHRV